MRFPPVEPSFTDVEVTSCEWPTTGRHHFAAFLQGQLCHLNRCKTSTQHQNTFLSEVLPTPTEIIWMKHQSVGNRRQGSWNYCWSRHPESKDNSFGCQLSTIWENHPEISIFTFNWSRLPTNKWMRKTRCKVRTEVLEEIIGGEFPKTSANLCGIQWLEFRIDCSRVKEVVFTTSLMCKCQ